MVKIGTRVKILYPEYAAGMEGQIEAKEASGRWLVRVTDISLEIAAKPLILSLEESDFTIINPEQ